MKNILTATQIKNVKPKEKDFLLSDGNGLYLVVRSSGTKNFSFKYSHPDTGKRMTISLGEFPIISLVESREMVLKFRNLISKGIDLLAERDKAQ